MIDARHSRHRSKIDFCHGYFGILSGRGWLRDSKTQIPAGPISSGAGHGKSAKSQARESEADRGNPSVRWSSKVFLTEPEKQKAHVIKITINTDQNYIKLPSSHEFDLFSRIHHEGTAAFLRQAAIFWDLPRRSCLLMLFVSFCAVQVASGQAQRPHNDDGCIWVASSCIEVWYETYTAENQSGQWPIVTELDGACYNLL